MSSTFNPKLDKKVFPDATRNQLDFLQLVTDAIQAQSERLSAIERELGSLGGNIIKARRSEDNLFPGALVHVSSNKVAWLASVDEPTKYFTHVITSTAGDQVMCSPAGAHDVKCLPFTTSGTYLYLSKVPGMATDQMPSDTTIQTVGMKLSPVRNESTGVVRALVAPSVGHNHDDRYYTEAEVDSALAGKSNVGHLHDDRYFTETEVTDKLAQKSDVGHDHDGRYYTETEVDGALANKSDVGHNHNDLYYTEAEVDNALLGKSNTGHDHDERYYTESEVDNAFQNQAQYNNSVYSQIGHNHDSRYYTETEVDGMVSGVEGAVTGHVADKNNPHAVTKAQVGLGSVDNTSDANKPVSIAVSNALALKEPLITGGTITQYWRGNKTWATLNKAAVGLGSVDNTSDLNKPISNATQSAITVLQNGINANADEIVRIDANTTSLSIDVSGLYGDVSDNWASFMDHVNASNPHGITKAMLGLGNVDNTSDADKPVSIATQAALDDKANIASPTFTGTVTAPVFSGSGSGLTNLPAANLSGSINDDRLSSNIPRLNEINEFYGAMIIYSDLQVSGKAWMHSGGVFFDNYTDIPIYAAVLEYTSRPVAHFYDTGYNYYFGGKATVAKSGNWMHIHAQDTLAHINSNMDIVLEREGAEKLRVKSAGVDVSGVLTAQTLDVVNKFIQPTAQVFEVAADGSREFSTIQAALAAATNPAIDKTILVYPGVYNLPDETGILVSVPKTHIKGVSRDSVIIQGSVFLGDVTQGYWQGVVMVKADDCSVRNVTIQNTSKLSWRVNYKANALMLGEMSGAITQVPITNIRVNNVKLLGKTAAGVSGSNGWSYDVLWICQNARDVLITNSEVQGWSDIVSWSGSGVMKDSIVINQNTAGARGAFFWAARRILDSSHNPKVTLKNISTRGRIWTYVVIGGYTEFTMIDVNNLDENAYIGDYFASSADAGNANNTVYIGGSVLGKPPAAHPDGITALSYLPNVSASNLAGTVPEARLPTAINATKIANGTVDNTEFQYLNGVTSAIQTQLNGKAAASHTHTIAQVTNLQTTLNGKANTGSANTFSGGQTFNSGVTVGGYVQINNGLGVSMDVNLAANLSTKGRYIAQKEIANGTTVVSDTLDDVFWIIGSAGNVTIEIPAGANGWYYGKYLKFHVIIGGAYTITITNGGAIAFRVGGTYQATDLIMPNVAGTTLTLVRAFAEWRGWYS